MALSITQITSLIQASITILLGYLCAYLTRALVNHFLMRFETVKHKALIRRIFFYAVFSLFLISALSGLGINLNVVLGAAGIFSIAIGFASQTSASNFISGLFLIFEKVVSEGDIVSVDGINGEVISVDLLSTKLKTADNIFIRIPNEMLIKSKMENLSRFSTRRLALQVTFPYEQNLEKVKPLWFSVVKKQPFCLKEPPPGFLVDSIGPNNVTALFFVWVKTKNYGQLKSELQQRLLEVLAENHIKPYVMPLGSRLSE